MDELFKITESDSILDCRASTSGDFQVLLGAKVDASVREK